MLIAQFKRAFVAQTRHRIASGAILTYMLCLNAICCVCDWWRLCPRCVVPRRCIQCRHSLTSSRYTLVNAGVRYSVRWLQHVAITTCCMNSAYTATFTPCRNQQKGLQQRRSGRTKPRIVYQEPKLGTKLRQVMITMTVHIFHMLQCKNASLFLPVFGPYGAHTFQRCKVRM